MGFLSWLIGDAFRREPPRKPSVYNRTAPKPGQYLVSYDTGMPSNAWATVGVSHFSLTQSSPEHRPVSVRKVNTDGSLGEPRRMYYQHLAPINSTSSVFVSSRYSTAHVRVADLVAAGALSGVAASAVSEAMQSNAD